MWLDITPHIRLTNDANRPFPNPKNVEDEMGDENRAIAEAFVDLALKYRERWPELKWLPTNEEEVLVNIVNAAGFEAERVVPGIVYAHDVDQDLRQTGYGHPTNLYCPFKVVLERDGDNRVATNWLERAVTFVGAPNGDGKGMTHDELVTVIIAEIVRSVPLKRMELTTRGDYLCERPNGFHGFGSKEPVHTRDSDLATINAFEGIHEFCRGGMSRLRATQEHDVLLCRICYLRVYIPFEAATYGDLRTALAAAIENGLA